MIRYGVDPTANPFHLIIEPSLVAVDDPRIWFGVSELSLVFAVHVVENQAQILRLLRVSYVSEIEIHLLHEVDLASEVEGDTQIVYINCSSYLISLVYLHL